MERKKIYLARFVQGFNCLEEFSRFEFYLEEVKYIVELACRYHFQYQSFEHFLDESLSHNLKSSFPRTHEQLLIIVNNNFNSNSHLRIVAEDAWSDSIFFFEIHA